MTNPDAGRLDPRAWFAHPDRRFEIEIGSGKGTFLIQEAERFPMTNFLGIEWAREFYEYAADRVRRRTEGQQDEETGRDALESEGSEPSVSSAQHPAPSTQHSASNIRLLHTDASELFRWRMPAAIASVIHLYFSDPWPKSRHHRRRVIQDQFLADAARILIPGGELRIVTDHEELWAWDCAHFIDWVSDPGQQLDATAASSGAPDVAAHRRSTGRGAPDSRPFTLTAFRAAASAGSGELVGTNFERKYKREGRPFHAATLVRV